MNDGLPMLRSHGELLTELSIAMRTRNVVGPDTPRWDAVEMRYAINQALRSWWGRVGVAHVLDLDGLAAAGEYGYTLPAYVREPVVVEFLVWPGNGYAFYNQPAGYTPGTGETWTEAPGWRVEPGADGGQVLRLSARPYSVPGRVVWWMPNGPGPVTSDGAPVELDGGIAADATSLTIDGAHEIHDAGYVKIGAEWLSYAGVDRGADTVLLNLRRGLDGTTAAVHANEAPVEWGIGVDRAELWQQLQHQVRQRLHEFYLTDGAEHERANHERMLQWYGSLVEEFWQRYVPSRRVRMKLGRNALH